MGNASVDGQCARGGLYRCTKLIHDIGCFNPGPFLFSLKSNARAKYVVLLICLGKAKGMDCCLIARVSLRLVSHIRTDLLLSLVWGAGAVLFSLHYAVAIVWLLRNTWKGDSIACFVIILVLFRLVVVCTWW